MKKCEGRKEKKMKKVRQRCLADSARKRKRKEKTNPVLLFLLYVSPLSFILFYLLLFFCQLSYAFFCMQEKTHFIGEGSVSFFLFNNNS